MIALCFIMQPMAVMAKSSKRTIRYNGKNYTYSKSAVKVVVDDETIKTPYGGVILDNISMVPAYQTFSTSSLGVSYELNASKTTLTLETEQHKVEIPLNKKYMYVDGKKKSLSKEAVQVYDKNTKKTCLMVPGRDVAEALGFVYEWNNSKVTSYFYTKEYLGMDSEEDDVDISTDDPSNSDEENTEFDDTTSDGDSEENSGETDSNNGSSAEDDSLEAPKSYSIKISKPEGMGNNAYEVNDNYWKKQLIITFEDDYSEFYDQNPVEKKKNNVKSVSVEQNGDGGTDIVLTTSKIQGFRITETTDALYVEVGSPQSIYDKIVVIDPGHGGSDPGTNGNGIVEKDKVLEIAKVINGYFEGEDDIKVYFTRLADSVSGMTAGSSGVKNSQMSLPARYNFANEIDADLFVSIHLNSFGTSANGTETFYSAKNTSKNEWGVTSKDLATRMQKAVQSVIGRYNRGVKVNSNLAVLTHTNMPAVLVEAAFVSNKTDAAILKNSDKIDELAQAIHDVIVESFE